MKPSVFLDSQLPKTSPVPIDPATGEVWSERLDALIDAATELHYGDNESEARARYDALREGIEFRQEPHFVKHVLCLGEAHAGAEVPEMIGCHPDTWALAPDEMKVRYEIVDCDESRRKMAGSTINIPTLEAT